MIDALLLWSFFLLFFACRDTKCAKPSAVAFIWMLFMVVVSKAMVFASDSGFAVYAEHHHILSALASWLAAVVLIHQCRSPKVALFITCYGFVHIYSLAAIQYPLYNLTDGAYTRLIMVIDALVMLSVVDHGTGIYNRAGGFISNVLKHINKAVEA